MGISLSKIFALKHGYSVDGNQVSVVFHYHLPNNSSVLLTITVKMYQKKINENISNMFSFSEIF